MVPVVGLEPTRVISPTDFESVTSTNSIIPADTAPIIHDGAELGKGRTEEFLKIPYHFVESCGMIRKTGPARLLVSTQTHGGVCT